MHRLLVHEIWILGDEYTLACDDESLRELLKKHLSILGRDEFACEVGSKEISNMSEIPDLMLSKRRKVDGEKFEHLVVELKRPSIRVGQKELTQIQSYAFKVANDGRFNTSKCNWEFVLLGNELDEFAESQGDTDVWPQGCVSDRNGVRIWVKRWADVLNDARARHEFFREQLKIEVSHTQGLASLKERHAHLFEGRGASKKKDLELSRNQ